MHTLLYLRSAFCRRFVRQMLPVILLVGMSGIAVAQLSGTYTIDPSGSGSTNYTSIENAIAALNSGGVSGSVVFRIAGGTITPPSTGYTLATVTGMSSTNTVTFKPASGASVLIDGNVAAPIFNISGGSYYVFDGSNTTGGTSRDLQIRNTSTSSSAPVIQLINGAQYNTIRNTSLYGSSSSSSTGIIKISTTTGTSGNSYNTIIANTLGDSAGIYRTNSGVYASGTSTAPNIANVIDNNDIINLGYPGGFIYGVYIASNNQQSKIFRNRIHVTNATGTSGVYPNYGVYFTNSSNQNDTIAYNRIWDLNTLYSSPSMYGVYISTAGSSPVTIHNNMIALAGTDGTLGGVYVSSNTSANINIYYNSIYLGGSGSTSSPSSYDIYASSVATIDIRNNVLVNARSTTGTTISGRLIYRASSTGTMTSDRNVLYNTGTTTAVGYLSSTGTNYTTLAAWQTASTQDANSINADPQYTSPTTGDLHISTTQRTPVEGNATPISGLTTDFDGNTRNATTPDIGADEGNFLPLLANDLAAVSFDVPASNGIVQGGAAFSPIASVSNVGTSSQTSVPIRYRILNSSNVIVYDDVQNVSFNPFETRQVTFGQNGSVTGSTVLANGSYTIELRAELPTDGNTPNDILTGTIIARSPLCGAYTIDPNGAGGRNYTSFTAAIADLNQVGVSCAVSFSVAGGTYDATRETFPLRINQLIGSSSTNTVTFKPAFGASVTIDGTVAGPIVELNGADYVILDGSNVNGGTTRDLTVINRNASNATVRFVEGATNDVLKNMVLMGSATSSTVGIVQFGTSSVAGGNSGNTVRNNVIGDPNGVIRSTTGIYALGSSGTYFNSANVIDGNDIVNFATGSTTSYGIYTRSGNNQVKIFRNMIHIPVKGSVTSDIRGIRFDNNVDNQLDTIAYNRIWDLSTSGSNTQYAIENYYMTSGQTLAVHNNSIALEAASGTLAGMYMWPSNASTIYIHHNSVYIGGTNSASSATSYTLYLTDGATYNLRSNVLVNVRSTTGTNSNTVIYRSSTSTTLNSDFNLIYANGASTAVGYASSSYATLAAWQGAGFDANSVSGAVPFINPTNGDLHINPQPVFAGEGRGTPLGYQFDFDGQARNAQYPDMGADEGNFNGGGIRVVYPNGGEQLPVNFQMPVQFTTNRPMSVRIQLSTNNGATWANAGTVDPTNVGTNTFIIATPDTVVNTALVRVTSLVNQYEEDLSDQLFSLVRPVLTIVAQNGGEKIVAGDTNRIRWSSQFVPPSLTVNLDYSTDAGATWLPIATNLTTSNLPSQNFFDWITPNTPTTSALVRVNIPGSSAKDASDQIFTILPQPNVTVVTPNGGEGLFTGDKYTITWSAVTTDYVKLEYSTNNGGSWNTILDRVPAYDQKYVWTVPNSETGSALVRITNLERPRYSDVSDATFSILRGELMVLAPNGGEQYELGEAVSVRWASRNATTLRLEYSADNGTTWKLIDNAVTAENGSYSFTPDEIPTKVARVRLSDADRPTVQDVSDMPFEVRASKSIVVLAPGEGDRLLRGSSAWIYFEANRINSVTIQYSSNGGSSWSTVVSNVTAAGGSYLWNVPNQLTENGMIRILEVGGTSVGMSGRFAIVDQTPSSIRIISPNGGEAYTEGDIIPIRWTASSDLLSARLEFSSNRGVSWTSIITSTPAGAGLYNWTAPSVPGTEYLVRISSGSVTDASDGAFTINRRLVPKFTILRPNGGEDFKVGASEQITWTETDITAPQVTLAYSTNNGADWTTITQVASGTLSYDWTVPDAVTSQALVRVSAGTVSDVSDAPFTISKPIVKVLDLTSPDGGEVWKSGEAHDITWTSTGLASGDNIRIESSLDGGTSWSDIIASTSSGAGSYSWTLPMVTGEVKSALVRITLVGDPTVTDRSQTVFTIDGRISSVVGLDARGEFVLRVLGNYPNPFAARTHVSWEQARVGDVILRIYDGAGRVAAEYDAGRRGVGVQEMEIGADDLPSGMYQYELRSGGAVARGMMMILR